MGARNSRFVISWKAVLIGLICLGAGVQSRAIASETPVSSDWKSMLEEMAEQMDNAEIPEGWSDLLTELADNPVELNSASRETLESIPFLTESQVEGLSYYLYRYGPMENMSEILLIEGMDVQTLRWLTPFVRLGSVEKFPVALPPMQKAFKYGKQEVRFKIGRTLQEKAGYEDGTYDGDPLQMLCRYSFNYKGKMQWGAIMEKDAGERVWRKSGGADYTSFHFMLKDQKRFQSLIIGDYKLRFGQGLICSGAFSIGKSTSGTSIESTGSELSRHFSSSESNYFRGIAVKFLLKPYIRENSARRASFGLSATPFASFRKLDGVVENDTIKSLSETGLHRTKAEQAIQNKVSQAILGGHLGLRTSHSEFGLTAFIHRYGKAFEPETKPYNQFYFRGKQGENISLDFRSFYRGILCFGEVATDENRKISYLTGLSIKPLEGMNLSMLYRNYALDFHAPFGHGFSEGSGIKNERGIFATVEWCGFRKLRLNGYFDIFRFPWLLYNADAPSDGQEYAVQCIYSPTRYSEISLRLKTKRTEKNQASSTENLTPLIKADRSQLRLQCAATAGIWSLKTSLYGTLYSEGDTHSTGLSLSQDIGLATSGQRFSMTARYACFDTPDYENRIYSWEKDLPGSFSMPMLYGKGSRYALFCQYQMIKGWSLCMKIGHSVYYDREKVGSGAEEVNGSKLTDIRAMICGKF